MDADGRDVSGVQFMLGDRMGTDHVGRVWLDAAAAAEAWQRCESGTRVGRRAQQQIMRVLGVAWMPQDWQQGGAFLVEFLRASGTFFLPCTTVSISITPNEIRAIEIDLDKHPICLPPGT